MHELRIGDRVRTPRGVGEVTDVSWYRDAWRVRYASGSEHWWDACDLEPLTGDIPRERVADLYAAVRKRLEQLDASRRATHFASERDIYTACHSDLSEVAEALRLLLGGES